MNNEKIGENILHFLKAKNLSQVDLARGVHASKQVINKIIKGKKALKIDELVLITQFLGVTIDELIHSDTTCKEDQLEAVQLYGSIKDTSTADFIISLIRNLSEMERELAAHGLLE